MFERTKNNLRKARETAGRFAAASIHVCKKLYTFQIIVLLIVAGSIGVTFTLYAAPNRAFVYQGRLTDINYTPVADGTYYMKVKIYSDPAGGNGNCVWATGSVTNASLATIINNCTEAVSTSTVQVTVAHGSFTIHLGDTTITGGKMPDISNLNFKTTTYYLGATVCGTTACTTDIAEMTPLLAIRGSVAGVSNINTLQANTFNQVPGSYTTVTGSEINNTDTTITSFTVGSTAGYPFSGTLLIDSEVMTYTGTTTAPNPETFTGVTRARHGTVAAAHSGSTVKIYLFSGAANATTRPVFFITSDGGAFVNANTSPFTPSQVALQISGSTSYAFGNDQLGNNYFNIRGGNLDDFSIPTFYRIRPETSVSGIYSAHQLFGRNNTLASANSTNSSTLIVWPAQISLTGSTQVTTQMDSILFNRTKIASIEEGITDAATFTIAGAPSLSANIATNMYALYINGAAVTEMGIVTPSNAYGLAVAAPTGATNNYAGIFTGGNVGIGTTAPITQLHVPGNIPTGALNGAGTPSGAGTIAVAVQGRYAYALNATANTLRVFDVSNLEGSGNVSGISNPGSFTFNGVGRIVRDGTTTVTGTGTSFTTQLVIGDTITSGGETKTITGIASNTLLTINSGFLIPTTGDTYTFTASLNNPRSIAVHGRYAYIANFVSSGRIFIIDISNPASPAGVSVIDSSIPRNVVVQGNFAYVVSQGNTRLEIIDISNQMTPVRLGTLALTEVPIGLFVQGRYAYITKSSAGPAPATNRLQVIDISNSFSPAAPVGGNGGLVTTGQVANSVYVQGRYAYVTNDAQGSGTQKFEIFDISNPASPTSTGSATLTSLPMGVVVQGRYAYVTNYSGQTVQFFDISNPASPTSLGTVPLLGGVVYPAVLGRFLYVPNFDEGTLQVLDIGGSYMQQVEVGGLEIASGQTRNNFSVNNLLDIRGGATIGSGGGYIAGPLSVQGLSMESIYSTFRVTNTQGTDLFVVSNGGGYIGIGTYLPAFDIGIVAASGIDRTIGMENGLTTGKDLTIKAGSAGTVGGIGTTNLTGGNLVLQSGNRRGNAVSKIEMQAPQSQTSTGTTLNSSASILEFVNGHIAGVPMGTAPIMSCPLAGTGTISSSGTTVTGSGTVFNSQLVIGSIIVARGQRRTVATVDNALSLTTDTAFSPSITAGTSFSYDSTTLATGSSDTVGRATFPIGAGSSCKLTFARSYTSAPMCTAIYEGVVNSTVRINGGSGFVSSLSTTITGAGTSFTNELSSGDVILANGQTRIIDTVTNNSTLTTTVAFSPVLVGSPFTIQSKSLVNFTFSPTPSAGDTFSYFCIGQGIQ